MGCRVLLRFRWLLPRCQSFWAVASLLLLRYALFFFIYIMISWPVANTLLFFFPGSEFLFLVANDAEGEVEL